MPVKTVTTKTYESFWNTVKAMDAEATGKKVPLVVIVKSTNQPDGTVWCRDCGILDKMLNDKLESMKLDGIIVSGEAGTLEEWLGPDNFFKTDATLSIQQIPTAYRYKDGKVQKRLECPDLFNPIKFKKFFS